MGPAACCRRASRCPHPSRRSCRGMSWRPAPESTTSSTTVAMHLLMCFHLGFFLVFPRYTYPGCIQMYQARAMYQATAIHTGYVSRDRYIPIHPAYKSREWPSTGIHAIHSRYVLDTRRDTYPEDKAKVLTTGLRWRLPPTAGSSSTTSLALALAFLTSGCGAARLRLAAGLTAGAAEPAPPPH